MLPPEKEFNRAFITEWRKDAHLFIASDTATTQYKTTTLFEYIILPYYAAPDMDYKDVDISATFLGRRFPYPIMISGMTGGTAAAKKINEALASFAENKNIPFQLGSMRAMLENAALKETYDVKKVAPDVFLIGNIGGAQLLEYSVKQLEDAANSLELDALAIHINALQEVIQPEGDRNWKGVLDKIEEVVRDFPLPVFVKEVGAGIGPELAAELERRGVEWIDIQGKGGTSWSKIEYERGSAVGGFEEWGIPTALAILLVREQVKAKIVGSGGIRSGIDIAKAFALGADFTAAAFPFLKALTSGKLEKAFEKWMEQVRIVLFLTNSRNLEEIRGKAKIYGLLREMYQAYRE